MAGTKPPMETGGAKESRTYQESADAADHRNGTATGKTIRLCLMAVHYDQYPEDPETDTFADQAHSSRDPLQGPSAEQSVRCFDLRHRCWDEPEGEIGSGLHKGLFCSPFESVPSQGTVLSGSVL